MYGMDEEERSPVAEALKAVLSAINDADGRDMVGKRAPKGVSIEVESGAEGCEDCKSGMCVEHMSPEDMAAMES